MTTNLDPANGHMLQVITETAVMGKAARLKKAKKKTSENTSRTSCSTQGAPSQAHHSASMFQGPARPGGIQQDTFDNYSPTFSAGICDSCFHLGSSNNLKRCAGCRLVFYCSSECQAAGRSSHKKLCKVFKLLRDGTGLAVDDAHAGGMRGLRQHFSALLLGLRRLGRCATAREREVLMRARLCEVCYRTDGILEPCSSCQSVYFCPEHSGADHACKDLLCSKQCDWIASREGGLPFKMPERYTPRGLCSGQLGAAHSDSALAILNNSAWAAYFQEPGALMERGVHLPGKPSKEPKPIVPHPMAHSILGKLHKCKLPGGFIEASLASPIMQIQTAHMSLPATILFAIHRISGISEKSEITVHIETGLTGQDVPVIPHNRFEYILHQLPTLRKLRLLFFCVHEELTEYDGTPVHTCSACCEAGAQMHITCTHKHWREVALAEQLPAADIFMSDNVCMWEEDTEEWRLTLQALAASSTPFLFTSFTAQDCLEDTAIGTQCGLDISLQPCMNPWRSLMQQPERAVTNNLETFYSHNKFMFGGGGIQMLDGDDLSMLNVQLHRTRSVLAAELEVAIVSDSGMELETCAICFETFDVGSSISTLPSCGHTFHKQCIYRWLVSSTDAMNCPNCRADVFDIQNARNASQALHIDLELG